MTPYNPKPVLDAVAHAIKGAVAKLDKRLDNLVAADAARFADEQKRVEQVRGEFVALGEQFDQLRADTGEMATELSKRLGYVDKGAIDRLKALASQLDNLDLEVRGTEEQRAARDQELDAGLVALRADVADIRGKAEESRMVADASVETLQERLSAVADLLGKVATQTAPVKALSADQKQLFASLAQLHKEFLEHTESLSETDSALDKLERRLIDAQVKGEGDIESLKAAVDAEQVKIAEGLISLGEACDDLDARVLANFKTQSGVGQELHKNLNDLRDSIGAYQDVAEEFHVRFASDLLELGLQVEEVPEVVEEKVSAVRQELQTQTGALTGALGLHIEETGEQFEEVNENIGTLLGRADAVDTKFVDWNKTHRDAETWGRGGSAYKEGAIVRHRGGFWQAAETTDTEPGEDVTWRLLADGVHDFGFAQHDERHIVFRLEFASGASVESSLIELPGFNFRGALDSERTYHRNELVLYRGSIYIVIAAGSVQTDDPANCVGMELFTKRGQRGARGPQGLPGVPPAMDDILRQFQAYMEQGDGTAITVFRGYWKYQETYSRGDVVVFDNSLRICVGNNDGALPPGGSMGQIGNDDWAMLFAPSGSGGGSGGGGSGGDVGTTDIVMEGTDIIFEDDQGDEIMSLPQTMYLVVDAISDNAVQIQQNTLDIAALESSQQYVRTGATGEVYWGAGAGLQYNAPLEIDVATVDTEGAVDLVNNQIVLDAVLTSGTAVRYAIIFTTAPYSTQTGEFSLFQDDVIVPGSTVTWDMDPDSGADVIVPPKAGVATIGPITVNGTVLTAGARIDVRCGIQGNAKQITVDSYQIDISLAAATAKGHAIVDQNGDFTPYNSLLQFKGCSVVDGIVSGGDQDGNPATVVDVGTLIDYGELSQDLGALATTLTIDISQGQSVLAALTGNVSTVVFENPSAHTATSFMLLMDTGGFDVLDWSGAVAGWFGMPPDLSSGGTHGFGFELLGGSWYGTHKGQVN